MYIRKFVELFLGRGMGMNITAWSVSSSLRTGLPSAGRGDVQRAGASEARQDSEGGDDTVGNPPSSS